MQPDHHLFNSILQLSDLFYLLKLTIFRLLSIIHIIYFLLILALAPLGVKVGLLC